MSAAAVVPWIVLLGPPGSGKGTQAKLIFEKYKIPQISSGDMFRKAIADDTALGRKAYTYMSQGKLVPDDIVIAIIKERIAQPDCVRGCVLDGFPRTVPQAEALDEMFKESGRQLTRAVFIQVPDRELVDRLSERKFCLNCGRSYTARGGGASLEVCEACQHPLVVREDDREDTVRRRLEVYRTETEPVVKYYEKSNRLVRLDGMRPVPAVFSDLVSAVGMK